LDLRWIGGGSRLVVGGRWLLDWQARRYEPLACPIQGGAVGASSGCPGCDSPIAPDRERALHISDQQIAIDPLAVPAAGPPGASAAAWTALPTWVGVWGKPPPPPEEIADVGLWLSPQTVLIQQLVRSGTTAPACRVCELPAAGARACRWR